MSPDTVSSVVARPAAGDAPLALEAGCRQVFLDDWLVESMDGLQRVVIPAVKHPRNPLLTPEPPKETEITVYGTVVREASDRWRMWYLSSFVSGSPGAPAVRRSCMAYAESRDGLQWRRPVVAAVRSEEEPANSVLGVGIYPHFNECPGVLYDPADTERPYKTVIVSIQHNANGCVDTDGRRYRTAFSRDGLRWTVGEEIPTELPTHPDICHLTYDAVGKRYVLWARAKSAPEAVRRRAPATWFGRGVSLLTSADFEQWHDHGVVLEPDLEDAPAADLYSLAAFRYGGLWIGLVQYYDQTPGEQLLEMQLACSRDGTRWTRLAGRRPILPVGGIGEWDRFNQSVASNPLIVGDAIWLYYGGRTYRHPLYAPREADSGPRWGGIGLAMWRRDGFAALEASFRGGDLLTKPLRVPAPDLFLNVKSDYGVARIEALDMQGRVLAEGLPVRTNSVRAKVDWKGEGRTALVADRPLRLRVHLENARLFALWFGENPADGKGSNAS